MRRLHFSLTYVGQVCIIKRPSYILTFIEINDQQLIQSGYVLVINIKESTV